MRTQKILIWCIALAFSVFPAAFGLAQDKLVEEASQLAAEEEVDVSRIDEILRGVRSIENGGPVSPREARKTDACVREVLQPLPSEEKDTSDRCALSSALAHG